MNHIPYGYHIRNGKAVIDKTKAEQIRTLFKAYLEGNSIMNAAKKAGINLYHSSIGNMLKNKHYLGDEYYPAIISKELLEKTQVERLKRVEKINKTKESKQKKKFLYPTSFHMQKGTKQFNNPFKQAEYTYSLIESEVI